MTIDTFAKLIDAPVEDVRRLIASRTLVVGQNIPAGLAWLAESKLITLGWRTPDGKTVPPEKRPRTRMASPKRSSRVRARADDE